jgi:hypothetical protein
MCHDIKWVVCYALMDSILMTDSSCRWPRLLR